MKRLLSILAFVLFAISAQAQAPLAKVGGKTYASAYANWRVTIQAAPATSGAGTITVTPGIPTNPDGSQVFNAFVNPGGALFTPIIVGLGSANQETVTPTAISGCNSSGAGTATCQITATFANTHGPGDLVVSGDAGVDEAINNTLGGGVVVVDSYAPFGAATDANLRTANVFPNVVLEDTRGYGVQYWTPIGGATGLAVPATLVAATAGFGVNGANFTGGFYTGSNTYIACIAYVDIMGQEGPCSLSFTIATSGSATTDQIGFTAPAASTGAVGYTIYITLNGGAYVSAYKVPLVSQPTTIGAYPAANGVCTLTTIEKITPACALTNANYGQTGVGAVVSALTLNTSPIDPQVTTVSSTTIYTPNAGGRTTYTYAPSSHVGLAGMPSAFLPFTISAAEATTVPSVIGTVNIAPGAMNVVGRTLEVCGKATTTASTATIVSIQFQWDSMGQNTAGKGVQIGNLGITPASAFATTKVETFCEDFQTTVQSASATGGSINTIGGFLNTSGVATAAAGQGAGSDPTTGAVGSLNLAADARLNVISVHTTGTDGTALTLQSLTARVF